MSYEFITTLENKITEEVVDVNVVISWYAPPRAATYWEPPEFEEVEYQIFSLDGKELNKDDWYSGDDLEADCIDYINACRDYYDGSDE